MTEANSSEKTGKEVDIKGIMKAIPHRYPFLLIDKVEDIFVDESAVGVKNVTINEPFFQGHFPGHPVMPGVLIIEAMAQTSAVLVVETLGDEARGKVVYFMTVDEARFRNPVVPGDTLKIKVSKKRQRGQVWKFDGQAVNQDGKVCAQAIFSAMIMDEVSDGI